MKNVPFLCLLDDIPDFLVGQGFVFCKNPEHTVLNFLIGGRERGSIREKPQTYKNCISKSLLFTFSVILATKNY